jgi:hypothetical protein
MARPAKLPADLAPALSASLGPYLGQRATMDEAQATVETAWHRLLAAERDNPLLDLRLPMRIRAVLQGAFARRDDIPDSLEPLLIGAALYFGAVDDEVPDLLNAWGFDDDQRVVDGVVAFLNTRGCTLWTTETVFHRRNAKTSPRKRKRRLPALSTKARAAIAHLPKALADELTSGAANASEAARLLGADVVLEELAVRIGLHLERARARAGEDRLVNLGAATTVAAELHTLLDAHSAAGAFNDQVLPLIIAAGELFVRSDPSDDDFASSFGFDSDREAVRAVSAVIHGLAPQVTAPG